MKNVEIKTVEPFRALIIKDKPKECSVLSINNN